VGYSGCWADRRRDDRRLFVLRKRQLNVECTVSKGRRVHVNARRETGARWAQLLPESPWRLLGLAASAVRWMYDYACSSGSWWPAPHIELMRRSPQHDRDPMCPHH